jgi:hypothetical protein
MELMRRGYPEFPMLVLTSTEKSQILTSLGHIQKNKKIHSSSTVVEMGKGVTFVQLFQRFYAVGSACREDMIWKKSQVNDNSSSAQEASNLTSSTTSEAEDKEAKIYFLETLNNHPILLVKVKLKNYYIVEVQNRSECREQTLECSSTAESG